MKVARFRSEYEGEFILTEVRISNGQSMQKREWVTNPVASGYVSPRAVCVGGPDFLGRFDFRNLQNNKGGLLAKKALQTYGTSNLWRDMPFNVFVINDISEAQDMIEAGYTKDNLVYTTSKIRLEHPGHFYPVPYMPVLDQLALSVYLAAFDGHREIFLLNYNIETPSGDKNWIANVNKVFRAYSMINFVLVGVNSTVPDAWRNNLNVSLMGHRDFVTHCDI